MKNPVRWLLVALLLAGLAGAWWRWQHAPPPAVAAPPPPAAAASPAVAAASVAAPAVQYPIESIEAAASAPAPLPPLGESDAAAKEALVALLGRDPVLRLLQVDDFVRRVVATVDNLARERATSRLWPVQPAPGRLLLVERADGPSLADGNAERYTPFVKLVESLDTDRAVALYVRLYPLFQQAYEELGYPGRYFNDRLVEVIDVMLRTPEPVGPVLLTLPEIQGPYASKRPWVRYRYADPALESLSAGQKMLLRMGPANAGRLKARLRALRERVARRPASR